jgi:3-phenylpropionate/trans-cinnamate dioxygenase ferredoxin reductase subunit
VVAGKRAVIIGGGYIGLETAASLRKQGMAVVVLEMADRILQRVTAPALSEFYTRIHREEGVGIHTGVSVKALVGDTRVERVVCADGTEFPADLVIIGVGVVPNVELARPPGLRWITASRWMSSPAPTIRLSWRRAIAPTTSMPFTSAACGLESVPNAGRSGQGGGGFDVRGEEGLSELAVVLVGPV